VQLEHVKITDVRKPVTVHLLLDRTITKKRHYDYYAQMFNNSLHIYNYNDD